MIGEPRLRGCGFFVYFRNRAYYFNHIIHIMANLIKLLENAQIYSIEYCGYFALKFTLATKVLTFEGDLRLEFVSGVSCFCSKDEDSLNKVMLSLYGTNILKAELIAENSIQLELSNGVKIVSVKEENVLVDRDWILETTGDTNNFILSDKGDLYYSESMRAFFVS